ncbi:MAG: DUF4367 domain-containing protein [Clostridia bacterium]|nr:DUF4367 domain-containing protein [Clostridia bacterium]
MCEVNDTQILNTVFEKYTELICDQLPSEAELEHITFSTKFEKNVTRIIKHHDKFYYVFINTFAKRVACIIIATFLLLSTVTLTVDALREFLFDFFVQTFGDHSEVTFEPIKETKFTPSLPTFIPEGFRLVSSFEDNGIIKNIYENNDQCLTFQQIAQTDSIIDINTENVDYEKISLKNDVTALYFKNKGVHSILFTYNESAFSISLYEPYSKEDLLQIAESVFN